MAILVLGPVNKACRRDEDGHRTYDVAFHIQTDTSDRGPAYILANWPLAAVGSSYSLDGDTDPWAFLTPEFNLAPHKDVKENDPYADWIVTLHWTTKPTWRCQTFPIENPLLEPVHIAGDTSSEQRTFSTDRFGKALIHPNYQPITGPAAEQKYSWPMITVTKNTATLPMSTYGTLINRVNNAVIWGWPKRCVRLIDVKWERLVYGTCFYYYRTSYTFEMDINTFDKKVPAEGTLRLIEGGDPLNSEDYELAKDRNDENISVPLDQYGRQVTRNIGNYQHIMQPQVALEGNFLLLALPDPLY